MRIGIVTGEYPPMQGGIGAYSHILAQHLTAQGAEVFIFSSAQAHTTDEHIPVENTLSQWNFGSLQAINRWTREKSIDILNLQFQTAAFGMSPWIHFLPHFTTVPVVTTFHDLRFPYLFPKAGKLRDWIVMHLAQQSAGIIVTNQEDEQRLAHIQLKVLIPIGSNIQHTLPDHFDAESWRAKAGAKPDDYLIGYFGLFNQTKGLETLLSSIASLSRQNIPVRLVMIGGGLGSSDPTNASYLNNLKTQIQQLGIEILIHWTGYLENEAEVGAYLAASDVIALPFTDGASYRRGSLMAAIQYGCPIITTRPSMTIPNFRDGENMLLVAPSDKSALSDALLKLWRAPELRKQLQQGARQLRQDFDWSHISRATLEFFEHLRKR
ncbi:MAG: glycosyltransferase family 4 protein [Chloroflexi bacterium]|nr:glycosyltransferase family 4 protein [Chloroflexota bacterium]MCC6893562.1 glycosyltransferase family 4 protein [Anaerolineae bacterium]